MKPKHPRSRTLMLIGGLAALICATNSAAQDTFQWRRSGAGLLIPEGAYIGGQEDGTPLVVCRAPYLGGVYPGKLVKGNCNIAYDSREIYLHDFDVLVGRGGQWAPPQPGLRTAFVAGYERGGPLYLCRAAYRGGLHPGKVYRDACDISYDGREIPIRRFNVFYVGASTVATYGGVPYAPTVVYRYKNNTFDNRYYPPRDRTAVDRAEQQRRSAAQQRADYQRGQQMQRDSSDRQQQEQQRADYGRNQQAQQAAEEARARAEGEAEENRQALKAQAQVEQEARRAEEIKRGEEEENRMAAEASRAQAEEQARKQAEIEQGEDEENRMAAEAAAKAQETPPPPNGDASSF